MGGGANVRLEGIQAGVVNFEKYNGQVCSDFQNPTENLEIKCL